VYALIRFLDVWQEEGHTVQILSSRASVIEYTRILMKSIDLSLPINVIKSKVRNILWHHFVINFDSDDPCTYHYFCPCTNCCNRDPIINFN